MKIEYDPEVDALYIELRNVNADLSIDIEEGVTVDFGLDGHIVGIEILDASQRLEESLTHLEFSELPLRRRRTSGVI